MFRRAAHFSYSGMSDSFSSRIFSAIDTSVSSDAGSPLRSTVQPQIFCDFGYRRGSQRKLKKQLADTRNTRRAEHPPSGIRDRVQSCQRIFIAP